MLGTFPKIMAIKIKKEPKEYYLSTKVYERCIFCDNSTVFWHLSTNTPVCKDCAKIHSVQDIKNLKEHQKIIENNDQNKGTQKSPFGMWS